MLRGIIAAIADASGPLPPKAPTDRPSTKHGARPCNVLCFCSELPRQHCQGSDPSAALCSPRCGVRRPILTALSYSGNDHVTSSPWLLGGATHLREVQGLAWTALYAGGLLRVCCVPGGLEGYLPIGLPFPPTPLPQDARHSKCPLFSGCLG